MAKEYPWFKFNPAAWMMGGIQRRPDNVQTAFIRIMCKYWHKKTELTIKEAISTAGQAEFDELVKHEIIVTNNDFIIVKFLDEQWEENQDLTDRKSLGGKNSAAKKAKNIPENTSNIVEKKVKTPVSILQDTSKIVESILKDTSTIKNEIRKEVDKNEIREEQIREDIKLKINDFAVLPIPDAFNLYKNLDECITVMLSEENWQASYALSVGIKNPDEISTWILNFKNYALSSGYDHKNISEVKKYCRNWTEGQIKKSFIISEISPTLQAIPKTETPTERRNRLIDEKRQQQQQS